MVSGLDLIVCWNPKAKQWNLTYLQKSGGTMPYTLILSQSSKAMVIVNQPVLNHELEILLKEKQRESVTVCWKQYEYQMRGML